MSEWAALPWWHRKVYLEGLADEMAAAAEGGDDGSFGDVLDDPFAGHAGLQ